MASIDEILLGSAPNDAQIPAIADALRRRRTVGQIGMASGLPNLDDVGKSLVKEADGMGSQIQDTRQNDARLQEAKDRAFQQDAQFNRNSEREGGQFQQSMSEEIRNHNLQDSRARDIALIEKKSHAGDLDASEYDALQKAIAEGRLNPDKLNSRTGKIYAQMELANPGKIDYNAMASEGAMMRNPTQMNRANVVEQLPTVISNMVEAGKKVGFSNFGPLGAAQAYYKEKSNDPDYMAYKAQRNDALMTIASAMRGVGMSDQAHAAEMEAANMTMSPRALEGWMKGQMAALVPRLKNAARYTRGNSLDYSGDAVAAPEQAAAPMGTSAFGDQAKEARYQAWKAAHGG